MSVKNIVVLGGAGDMGSQVVSELHKSKEIQVTMADYNITRAQKMASELGTNIMTKFVDADNKESLQDALSGAFIAINCIGPFYKYAFSIASTAIQAGVNYIDICDDDDATMALLSLDGLARRKNVSLLIGMGWTPGISNLLALHSARQMDTVEEIDTTWVGSASDTEGIAVIKHVFHAVTRNTPMYDNYQWIDVPALSGEKYVTFPKPIGTIPAYYCGHPEPVTIPRFLDGVKKVTSRGYLLPREINQLARTIIALELVNTDAKVNTLAELMQNILPMLSNFGEQASIPLSGIRVDVAGQKNGQPVTKSYCSVDSMNRLTGIPPAVTAMLMASGKITIPAGVYAPEGCLDPDILLEELAKRNIEVKEMSSD